MTQSTEGLEDLPRKEYKIKQTQQKEREAGASLLLPPGEIEFSKITYNACVSIFILVS